MYPLATEYELPKKLGLSSVNGLLPTRCSSLYILEKKTPDIDVGEVNSKLPANLYCK